jgi:hypothetical protein
LYPETPGAAASLLAERLELGDDFEVLGSAGVALRLNQAIQAQAVALDAEDRQPPAVREQGLVGAAARDLAQDVLVAGAGDEGEIEPSLDGLRVPAEGQSGRRATEVRCERLEHSGEARDIFRSPAIDDVQILGEPS